MIQDVVEVLWNRQLSGQYYHMGLGCHKTYQSAYPGQFVMVRLIHMAEPLLGRPFSIHRQVFEDKHLQGIELLYKVVGVVTKKLSILKKGDALNLLGPLGRGFRISETYHRVYIVAGGIGVAPLMFLADALKASNVVPLDCTVFLGGKGKTDLLRKGEFAGLGMEISLSTDDGSVGQACMVTQPLEVAVKKKRPDVIFACGPKDMLVCVQEIAKTYGVPCQISVETLMACGIGACLGGAIETRDNPDAYKHVCLDGPVFDAAVLA